jgi:serine/threonine protein kinase
MTLYLPGTISRSVGHRLSPAVVNELERQAAAGDAIPQVKTAVKVAGAIYKMGKEIISRGASKSLKVGKALLRRVEYRKIAELTIEEKRSIVPSQTASEIDRARRECQMMDFLANDLEIPGIAKILKHKEKFDVKTRWATIKIYMPFYEFSLSDKALTLDESEKDLIVAQLIRTVSALHAAGYVHRDLKPDNIRFSLDGKSVLIDFGSALSPEDLATSDPAKLAEKLANHQGTIAFYPDIILRDESNEDHLARLKPADVYALGLTLASFYLPEEAETISKLASKTPEERDQYVNFLVESLLVTENPFKHLVAMMLSPIEHSIPALTRPSMSELLEIVEFHATAGKGIAPPPAEQAVTLPNFFELSAPGIAPSPDMLSSPSQSDLMSHSSPHLLPLRLRRAISSGSFLSFGEASATRRQPELRLPRIPAPYTSTSPANISSQDSPFPRLFFPDADELEATVVLSGPPSS